MNGFLYTLTLEEPVLANSLGGEPNSANSLFYIPGGLVRGAVIGTYAGTKNSEDDTFRDLFLNGKTRYLNAYPLMNSQRTLPIPVKFKKPKYSEAGDFGQVKADVIEALEEIWQINVHTQRDAERGRSTSDSGAVFRYIALPVGMQFQGVVIGDDAQKVRSTLDNTIILLGKARTAGYGRARATVSDLPDNWAEGGQVQVSLPEKSTQFTITFLSPALVRDENGQFSTDITTALASRLGQIDKIESVYRSEIAGGFNRTWGLPLPQVTAIAAGSVFTVTTKNFVTAEKLLSLEITGLGERRSEGFGSLAINFSMREIMEDEKWSAISPETLTMFASGSELPKDVTELMLSRLLRRDMDALILTASRDATSDIKESAATEDVVPNSQLSRWRVILRDALSRKDESVLKDGKEEKYDLIGRMLTFYETENKKRSAAWVKMEKARVNQINLTKWIEEVLKEPNALNENLGVESLPTRKLGNHTQTVDEAEYRLLLIDAVLARIIKINKGRKVKHA